MNQVLGRTVPAGVVMLGVEAVGCSGAPAIAGTGMDLGAALPVSAGEVLYVEVGQSATGSAVTFGGGGAGGAGDAAGGAGGGASDVRACSINAARCPGGGTSLASRLIVAGGGGGAGGEENSAHRYGITCGGGPYAGIAQSQGTVKVAGARFWRVVPTTPRPGRRVAAAQAWEWAASHQPARAGSAHTTSVATLPDRPARRGSEARAARRAPGRFPVVVAVVVAAISVEAAARAGRLTSPGQPARPAGAPRRTDRAVAEARVFTSRRRPARSSTRTPALRLRR